MNVTLKVNDQKPGEITLDYPVNPPEETAIEIARRVAEDMLKITPSIGKVILVNVDLRVNVCAVVSKCALSVVADADTSPTGGGGGGKS